MALFQSGLFFRIIFKNKEAYFLKIITLTVAFWCSILIILFALNEYGYDRFNDDPNTVFRIIQRNLSETYSGNRLSGKIASGFIDSMRLMDNKAIILSRMKVMNELSVMYANQRMHSQTLHAADSSITDIFSFEILEGSLDDFRNSNETAILSLSAALKYTGDAHATGKRLKVYSVGDTIELIIAAVFRDFPSNVHEDFNLFMRHDSKSINVLGFDSTRDQVYGRVSNGNYVDHEKAINNLVATNDLTYRLQPLPEIHFGPRVLGEEAKHGDSYSILILISIAGLILFLALTSFVNLTMLTLPHRSKELAVKKLAGITQFHLTSAFIRESFIVVGISLILGALGLFLFSNLIAPALSIDLLTLVQNGSWKLIIITTVLFLMLSLTPVLMTLRFIRATPTRLLSTETITFPRFKRTITFLQLGVSIFLIVSSLVLKRQINYSLIKEPGRNHDQVVYLNYPQGLTSEGLESMRVNWKRNNPNIVDVMGTSQLPGNINSKELNSPLYLLKVDPGFFEFFGLKLLSGKGFSVNASKNDFIVNQKGRDLLYDDQNVVGVIENVNAFVNQPEKPIKVMIDRSGNYNFLCIRILEINVRRTVSYLADSFRSGDQEADIRFLNKGFENWLNYQDRLNSLSNLLAIIAGILSCLAIYGLSVTLVRDKLKQIAIHKLCGATISHITRMLVKDFAKQLILAIVIFAPFTYILISEMLRSFVYATPFHWEDPVIPLAYCVIVIALLCGFQALTLNRRDLTSSLKG